MNRTLAPQTILPLTIDYVLPHKHGGGLWWMDCVQDNTCSVEVHWPIGTLDMDSPAVMQAWAALVVKGTDTLGARAIQEKVDELGGYFALQPGKRSTILTIYGLQDTIGALCDLILKVMAEAVIPQDELDVWKTRSLRALEVSMEKVSTLAVRRWRELMFHSSVYARQIQLEDFPSVTQEEVLRADAMLKSAGCEAYVVGQANEGLNELLLERLRFSQVDQPRLAVPETPDGDMDHMVKEGAIQSAIIQGCYVPILGTEDRFKLDVVNCMLGGYFGSRLMMNLREDKGFTYGISSSFEDGLDYSIWRLGTEVGDTHRGAALTEIHREIELLSSTAPSREELERVRRYMIGSMLRAADGGQAMMDRFKYRHKLGLPEDFYAKRIENLHRITPEDARDVCRRFIGDAERLTVTSGS